jgi:hypothetical protein
MPLPRAEPVLLAGESWHLLTQELELWRKAGQKARLWLRDDDAVAVTPALERLLAMSARHKAPLLICVIPMRADETLAARLASAPLTAIAMHGVWHQNHATPPQKSAELTVARGREAVLDDLATGRERLAGLFGPQALTWYVPPWNRIPDEVAAWLPEAGFTALSTFSGANLACTGVAVHNSHLDLIDWRNGRVGRSPDWVARELAAELAKARAERWRAVGVLTHHLDHDETAWATLDMLLARTCAHPAVRWCAASELLG